MTMPQPTPKAWAIFSAAIAAGMFVVGLNVDVSESPRWLRDTAMVLIGVIIGGYFTL